MQSDPKTYRDFRKPSAYERDTALAGSSVLRRLYGVLALGILWLLVAAFGGRGA